MCCSYVNNDDDDRVYFLLKNCDLIGLLKLNKNDWVV